MPKLAITPKLARRIRELAGEGQSNRQIAATLAAESGASIAHTTIGRFLKGTPQPGDTPPPLPSRLPPARSPPPSPPPPDDDLDELAELRANARQLRVAIDELADVRALPALVDAHRKVLAAIRTAKVVGEKGDEQIARTAAAIRQRLAAYAAPSPPTFAEQQERDRSALPDEPRASDVA